METALAAVLIVFLVLFGALTLSETFVAMHDEIQVAWQDMTSRLTEQSQTRLAFVDAQVDSTGKVIELTLRNEGATRLGDYRHWDAFIQYYDASASAFFSTKRLPYASLADSNDLPSLFKNAGVFLGSGGGTVITSSELSIIDPDHMPADQIFILKSSPIEGQLLLEAQALTAGDLFTQDDINNGRLSYAHQGNGTTDSFTYAVADSTILGTAVNQWSVDALYVDATTQVAESFEPEIWNPGEELVLQLNVDPPVAAGTAVQITLASDNGTNMANSFLSSEPYTFTIGITPQVEVNTGLAVANGGMVAVTNSILMARDDILPAENIVYTVTAGPSQGTLSLGSSFTQAQINAGELTYSHNGSGLPDSFEFSVTAGGRTTGTYTCDITVS